MQKATVYGVRERGRISLGKSEYTEYLLIPPRGNQQARRIFVYCCKELSYGNTEKKKEGRDEGA